MRVLFDHQTFSHQRYGGNSRYFAELMSEFYAAGEPNFELSVAWSPNEYLRQSAYYRGRTTSRMDLAGFLLTYTRNIAQTAIASRRPHDIFHATFYDPGALRFVGGAKLVVTVLDMIPERFPDFFKVTGAYGRFITKRWIVGKRQLCERADAILAISENTKRDLVELFGIDPTKITVTLLGNRLVSVGKDPRPDGFPERYVLYVGTRNTYKNFRFLAEAIAPILSSDPSLQLVCIGGGAFVAEETSLLERLGVAARVVQRSVRDNELAACYAHARAFVFPSRYEGFGIPIVEAFGCGCPAIVARASCFPEIADDAARYFDPDDAGELRAELSAVLYTAGVADELRRKGRARASQLTWRATAERTLDVYRAVAGRTSSA